MKDHSDRVYPEDRAGPANSDVGPDGQRRIDEVDPPQATRNDPIRRRRDYFHEHGRRRQYGVCDPSIGEPEPGPGQSGDFPYERRPAQEPYAVKQHDHAKEWRCPITRPAAQRGHREGG